MKVWATGVMAVSLTVVLGLAAPAQAAEITVLGSQGNISGIRDLAAAFEQSTGNKVIAVQEANMGAKINSDAPADVVTGGPGFIDGLIKSGKVVGPRVDWAKAGIGMGIKAGAPKPDIHDLNAFVRALRNAKSIGYSSVGSGEMMHNIIKRLGLE